jgi:hypothetical protein
MPRAPNRIALRAARKFHPTGSCSGAGKSFLAAHQNGSPCGNPVCGRYTSPPRGLFFARNRMTALQVSPGKPASRCSCVGQWGAHPYRDHKNTTVYRLQIRQKAGEMNPCTKPDQTAREPDPGCFSFCPVLLLSIRRRNGPIRRKMAGSSGFLRATYASPGLRPCSRRSSRSSSIFF